MLKKPIKVRIIKHIINSETYPIPEFKLKKIQNKFVFTIYSSQNNAAKAHFVLTGTKTVDALTNIKQTIAQPVFPKNCEPSRVQYITNPILSINDRPKIKTFKKLKVSPSAKYLCPTKSKVIKIQSAIKKSVFNPKNRPVAFINAADICVQDLFNISDFESIETDQFVCDDVD